jgi:hypothetical protein
MLISMHADITEDDLTAGRHGIATLMRDNDLKARRRCRFKKTPGGIFLRLLEYFNGRLCLTTNHVDDIDEVIVSR